MFRRQVVGDRLRVLVVAAGLLMGREVVLAQLGGAPGGGGHVGPNTSGGVNEKDELKNYHQAIASQATAEQAAEFRSMVKSTETANQQLQDLGTGSEAFSSKASALRQELEKARIENKKFLDGLSLAQRMGLRDLIARLQKADVDVGEQEKALAGGANESREGLGKALTNFRKEQDGLGVEMGILQLEPGNVAFHIPPLKGTVTIANQPVTITASAIISRTANGENIFKIESTTDLSDLQQNMTAILSSLNKEERCGERIKLEDAQLIPSYPASTVIAQLHYQRWVCRKMGGGEAFNEVAEGNARVEVKLTPGIATDGGLQIVPEIVQVKADKFLSDLVRTGALGAALKEKIEQSLLAAIVDVKTELPPSGRDSVKLQSARFESTPGDQLNAVVTGEMRVSDEQAKLLGGQIKEWLATRPVASR